MTEAYLEKKGRDRQTDWELILISLGFSYPFVPAPEWWNEGIMRRETQMIPPPCRVPRSKDNGKTPAGKRTSPRQRVQTINKMVRERKEEAAKKKARLSMKAAVGTLVEMKYDTGRYNYSCINGCMVLNDYKWLSEKTFRPRMCPMCAGMCFVKRSKTLIPRKSKKVTLTEKKCWCCKHQFRSGTDAITHTLFGKCAETRESCVIIRD